MACAAGLATLEVIEEDGIMKQAEETGQYLLEGLKTLQNTHPSIGDVRGKGCLLGIEFVKNRETKEPFLEASSEVYKECMKRKLIPGVPAIHLLRLAPQLMFDKEILGIGLSILDESIFAVEKKFGFL